MAESLLAELGIERVLVLGESCLTLPCGVKTFTGTEEDLVACVQFIKGVTLVYSKVEARACVVVGAYRELLWLYVFFFSLTLDSNGHSKNLGFFGHT